MRLIQALERAVRQGPEGLATVCQDRRRSYAQLQDRVARLAAGLRGLGVREGQVVALLGVHSDHLLEAQLALDWIGAIACPLDARREFDALTQRLNASEALLAFVDERLASQVDALLDACPYLRGLVYCGDGPGPEGSVELEALIARHEPVPSTDVDEHASCCIVHGSTATAVEQSSHRLFITALALMAEGPFRRGCTALQMLPLAEPLGGLTNLCVLLAGGTFVLAADDPRAGLKLIREYQCTDLVLTSEQAPALLDAAIAAPPCPSVRHVVYAAATTDAPGLPPLAHRGAFPGASALLLHGPAEACGFAGLRALDERDSGSHAALHLPAPAPTSTPPTSA